MTAVSQQKQSVDECREIHTGERIARQRGWMWAFGLIAMVCLATIGFGARSISTDASHEAKIEGMERTQARVEHTLGKMDSKIDQVLIQMSRPDSP